jgi:hypothetical protein
MATKGSAGAAFSLPRSIISNSERRLRRRKRTFVELCDFLGQRGVGLGEREQLPEPQRRQPPPLDLLHRILRRRLVTRFARPGRDDRHAVMAANS